MLSLTRSSSLCLTVLLALTAMTFRPPSHTLVLLHYQSLNSRTIIYNRILYTAPFSRRVETLSRFLLTVNFISATEHSLAMVLSRYQD